MKNFKRLTVLGTASLALLAHQTAQAEDYYCLAPAKWFAGKTVPIPNPAAPIFADGDNNTKCDFHKYAWQMFLWLTEKSVDGKLRFEKMYSERAIDPKTEKPRAELLGGVQQAQSLGIVVDKNGRAVYTTMAINEIYRDFVILNKLYTRDGMEKISPETNFPVGALSLKAAWRIVKTGEVTNDVYTKKAMVAQLETVNGVVTVPKNPVYVEETVALVGLHIAQVLNGHPEALWATFEHNNNAPSFNPAQTMNAAVSGKSYTFYQANTTAADCNANNANVVSLDKTTQLLSPVTQVCRQYLFGGGTNINETNIATLNQSVYSQMPAKSLWRNYMLVGSEWFSKVNSKENPSLVPNWSPNLDGSMITGSKLLSSSVIETFTQSVTSANQCFSCHNTMPLTSTGDLTRTLPGKNISTSHILLQKYLDGKVPKR